MPKYWFSVDERIAEALEMEPVSFRELHPSPVLVAREILGGKLRRKTIADDSTTLKPRLVPMRHQHPKQQVAGTLIHMKPAEILARGNQPELADRPVSEEIYTLVQKTDRTPPDQKIMVGRTAKSDVVINDYSVSKTHACFVLDPRMRTVALYDLNSTNGTFINGRKLEPRGSTFVNSGSELGFGRYSFLFLSSVDFHKHLTHMTR